VNGEAREYPLGEGGNPLLKGKFFYSFLCRQRNEPKKPPLQAARFLRYAIEAGRKFFSAYPFFNSKTQAQLNKGGCNFVNVSFLYIHQETTE